MQNKSEKKSGLQIGTASCGILCGTIGAIIAIFWLIFGFWSMLFIVAMFGLGLYIGLIDDKVARIKRFIARLFPTVEKVETPMPKREVETDTPNEGDTKDA